MAAVLYLILSIAVGMEICQVLLIEKGTEYRQNKIWVFFTASFAIGTLLTTWILYMLSWLMSMYAEAKRPLFCSNFIIFAGLVGIFFIIYKNRFKEQKSIYFFKTMICDRTLFIKEAVFYSILLIFITWIMFYMFHAENGVLYSGFTVYGDYAPHTAMIRSFSEGNNFPTQYPHFGGEDIKYHFMFQFLTGNLEYLGMRIDLAYNVVSIMALWSFLVFLCQMVQRITRKMTASVFAVILFLFRSGMAFLRFVVEHAKAGDLGKTLAENTSFIGYTMNENWGLWNFNVYLNQRHLAFGMLLAAIAVWIYMDWLQDGCKQEKKGIFWFKDRLFSKEAWLSKNFEIALIIGAFLGMASFWNGAAVIGGLLMLMGMAAFSDGKLDYVITAITAVVFSVLQTKMFIKGSAVHPTFFWGFLAEEKTLSGVIQYLFEMSGIFFLGLFLVFFLVKKRFKRVLLISFLFPVVFAFVASLTPDINVNHKYIMIAYAFLTIFWADILSEMWSRKWLMKIAALLLTFILTFTGIYDFVIILRGNDKGHRVGVYMESDLTEWLEETMEKEDLILTPEYSMNEVTMSGAMMYMGWPYYAWSAGYDTYRRADIAVEIYTTENKERIQELVTQEKITYILFEQGMTFEEHDCREDVIAEMYPLVYTDENGGIRVYETR